MSAGASRRGWSCRPAKISAAALVALTARSRSDHAARFGSSRQSSAAVSRNTTARGLRRSDGRAARSVIGVPVGGPRCAAAATRPMAEVLAFSIALPFAFLFGLPVLVAAAGDCMADSVEPSAFGAVSMTAKLAPSDFAAFSAASNRAAGAALITSCSRHPRRIPSAPSPRRGQSRTRTIGLHRLTAADAKTSWLAYSTIVSFEKPADRSRFMAEALAAARKLIGDGDQG
jgi:hypothetical protein